MKNKRLWGALLLSVLAVTSSQAADKGKEMNDAAMHQAWMEAGTPGPQHQTLASMAGTWDTTVKSWMAPNTEPMESKGTAEFSMELGGRYLSQHFRGEMMGQPYEGFGQTGYDKAQKKWVSTWMDNMSTGIMMSTGVEEVPGKKYAYTGKSWDPMTDKEIMFDETLTLVNPDQQLFEMYMPGPDGKKFKCMEIQYNRRKS